MTHHAHAEQIVDQVVIAGGQLWVSGQIASADGRMLATGALGDEVDVETGQRCARQCAANVLDRVREVIGKLESIERFIKLTVYVASASGFTQQHTVANGASRLLLETLGPAGRHAGAAIGVAALPLGSPVEVDAIVLLDRAAPANANAVPKQRS